MTDSRSFFSFQETPSSPSHTVINADSNKTITQVYWKKNLGSAAVTAQDFRRIVQGSAEKVFCVLCILVSGKVFFFCCFALLYFGVLLFPNLAYIQDNQGTVKTEKRGPRTAWLMWPVGPAPPKQPWEGVSGLGASGPCLVYASVAQRPPACQGQSSSTDRPPTAFTWGYLRPGRAATELTVLSPEIWLLQVGTSTLHLLSEGQSQRPQLWPPCS